MNSCSNYAYLNRKKKAAIPNILNDHVFLPVPEVDTNVISLTFDTLKASEDNMQMGDAYFCKSCNACVSTSSELLSKADYFKTYKKKEILEKIAEEPENEQVEEEKNQGEKAEEEQNPPKSQVITTQIGESDKIWVCEFCGVHNVLENIDLDEVPKNDDVIYLLQSAQKISKNPTDLESDISTVFCIDNSGSMSVTTEVKGKHDIKHGLSAEEYEMLKQFIEYGADQYLPNQKKDTTYVTRKQCVLAAIEDQLLNLQKEFPNRKVGLVTFDNEVSIFGDGHHIPEVIAGDKLYKFDIMQQMSQELGKKLITQGVKDSAEKLLKKFETLKESGKTALGPGLLMALGLAIQGKQGSKVILCTDGLANIGLGEMDTPQGLEKAEAFYASIANLAKESGVSVSVISIKGEGCKLGVLGKLVDETSGTLVRVDPDEITSKFANILKEEVLGTQVEVKLRLHKGLKFRNESEEFLKERASLFQKTVGNVTANTQLTFEYELRPDEELMEFGVDPEKLDRIPFQAQIIYTSTNGDKLMRVITQKLKTTQDLKEAEKDIQVDVIATRAIQYQANSAALGNFSESEEVGNRYGSYMGGLQANFKKGDSKVFKEFQHQSEKVQNAVYKKQKRAMKAAAPKQETDSKGFFGKVSDFFQSKKPVEKKASKAQECYVLGGGMNAPMSEEKAMEKNNLSFESAGDSDEDYETLHQGKNMKFL